MRLPRQWSGADLSKALAVLGYEQTRQTGSHIRMTTQCAANTT
jgi:predicted RNA binding protein YcfA (HicA-like mRNA interferase family)